MRLSMLKAEDAVNHKPKVAFVDKEKKIKNIAKYEKHGQLSE